MPRQSEQRSVHCSYAQAQATPSKQGSEWKARAENASGKHEQRARVESTSGEREWKRERKERGVPAILLALKELTRNENLREKKNDDTPELSKQ